MFGFCTDVLLNPNPNPNSIFTMREESMDACNFVFLCQWYLSTSFTMVSDRLSLLHVCFPIDLSFTVNSFLDYRPLHTLLQTNTCNNFVTLNETFSITCTAEANPPAKYAIYKDETRIVGNNSVVTSSVTERVKRVTFTCKPSNFYGVGQMADVSLDVLCK